MTERNGLIDRFLVAQDWDPARRGRLAGDASFRHYDRLVDGSRRAVLMDAPPPKEDVRPFVAIARHLRGLGYSAPEILAVDDAAGLLLLEDLGDDTFTRMLAEGVEEEALYGLAIDLLADLHSKGASAIPAGLPPYDDDKLLTEALLLTDWYVPEMIGGPLSEADREAYIALWRDLFPIARGVPDTLVLRDFHVDNLMRLERPGIAACGLLDFQDAVAGPLTYDLMSLMEDARRDIDPALIARMKRRYLEVLGLDEVAFEASWAVLAAQRHAKVIGIFTRLCRRDGKPIYLGHIPRLWRLLERAAAQPGLEPLQDWLDRVIPKTQRGVPQP